MATLRARAAELFDGETDAAFGDSVFRAALGDRQDYQSGDGVTKATPKGTGNYNQFWLIDRWFDNRTSPIVDPPNGRIPPRIAAAAQRSEAARTARATKWSADTLRGAVAAGFRASLRRRPGPDDRSGI